MAFLTPDLPSGVLLVTLQVPDTLLPSVVGALLELDLLRHWEEFGTVSVDDALLFVSGILGSITEEALISGKVASVVYAGSEEDSPFLIDSAGDLILAVE